MKIGKDTSLLSPMKSSRKRWAEALYDRLKDMDFIASRADQCIWLRKNLKDLNTYPNVLLTGGLPHLVTPPGLQIPPNAVHMTPG